MKLKLPLGLLAALLACINAVSYAVTNPSNGGTTNNGSNYYISQEVVWTTDYNYYGHAQSTVVSVGSKEGPGSLTVSGDGTDVNIGNNLFIGGPGNGNNVQDTANPGTVVVEKGATLEVGQHPQLHVGAGSQLNVGWDGEGIESTMTVTGEGSTAITNYALAVALGTNSQGLLTIDDGGKVVVRLGEHITNTNQSKVFLGYNPGSVGKLVVDNDSTLIQSGKASAADSTSSQAFVGYHGKGILEVKNGSTVNFIETGMGETVLGYYADGSGSISVVGSGSELFSGTMYVGYEGKGELNITNGASLDIDGSLWVGYKEGSTGSVAFSSDADVDISGNVILNSGVMDMGGLALGNVVYAQGAAELYGAQNYTGLLWMKDATLTVGNSTANSDINLAQNAQLYSGSIANKLTGTAGIIKLGAGTVELTGDNTYTGLTDVREGTLTTTSPIVGSVALGTSTTLVTPSYTLSAGKTLTMNAVGTVSGTLNLDGGELAFATMNPLRQPASTNKVDTLDASSANTTTVNIGDPDILPLGTYTLMSWTNGQDVTLADFALDGVANATGSRAAVELLLVDKALVLSVSKGEAATLIWDSTAAGGTWQVGEEGTDWITSAANKNFYGGDNVIFDGSWEGNETVTISGKVKPGSIVVSGTGSTEFTGSGSIEATTSLEKDGSGTLTLDTANTYTGGTTLRDGEMVLGDASALGRGDVVVNGGTLDMGGLSVANDVTVKGDATLNGASAYEGELTMAGGSLTGNAVNLGQNLQLQAGSVGNVLTGDGAVVKTTAGDATLSGANSYAGGTSMEAGTLTLGHEDALGTGDVSLTGGTLDMGGNAVANNVTVNGDAALNGAETYEGQLTLLGGSLSGGTINIEQGQDAQLSGGSIANDLSGTGGVVKSGSGTVTLSGTNSYTGDTVVQGGKLITSSSPLGDISVASGAVLQVPELQLGSGQDLALASGATVQGNVSAASGSTLTLDGGSAVSGTLSLDGGTLTLDPASGALTLGTLDVNSASTLVLTDLTSFSAGSYDLLSYSGFTGSPDNLTLIEPEAGDTRYSYELVKGDAALTLTVTGYAYDLTWDSTQGTWALNDNGDKWFVTDSSAGEKSNFCQGDHVTFDNGGTVDLTAEVSPGSITVTGDSDVTINDGGGSLSGAATLTKEGTGTLTINTANPSLTGDILISGGYTGDTEQNYKISTVKVGNKDALGQGTVELQNGAIDMNGLAVSNTVEVNGQSSILNGGAYEGQLIINGGELTCYHHLLPELTHELGHLHVSIAEGKDVLFNGGLINDSYTFEGKGGIIVNAGDGVARLNGTHTYTGSTLVQSGTMVLDGSVSGTDILVSKGATLDMNVGKFSNGSLIVEDGGTLIGGTNDLALSGSDKLQLGTGTPEGEEAAKTELKGDLTASADSHLVLGGGSNVELTKDDEGDATLTLTGGATVTLDTGATLTVTPGAQVVVDTTEATGGLNIESGATIVIDDMGAETGKLVLGDGAKVYVTADQDQMDQAEEKNLEMVIVGSASGNSSVIEGAVDSKVELDQVTRDEYRSSVVVTDKKISVIIGREDLKWNSETNDALNCGVWKAGTVTEGVTEVKHWNHVEEDASGDIVDLCFADNFYHRDSTVFMDNTADGAEQKITLEGTVKPSAIKVIQDTDLLLGDEGSTGSIGGSSTIQKDGAGTLTLGTANSFSGGLVVFNGAVVLDAQDAQGTGTIELVGEGEGAKAVLDAGRYEVTNEVIISGDTELRQAVGLTAITFKKGSVTDVDKPLVLHEGMVVTVDGADYKRMRSLGSSRAVQKAPVTSEVRQSVVFDGLTLNFVNQGRIGFTGQSTIAGGEGASTSLFNMEQWGADITRRDEIGLIHFMDYATKGLEGAEYVDSSLTVNLENDVLEQYAHLRLDEDGWVVLYFTAPYMDPELARQLSHNQRNAYGALVAIARDNEDGTATDPLSLVAAQAATADNAAELRALLDDVSGSEYATMMSSQIEGNLAHLRRLRGHMGNGTTLAGSKSGLAGYADAFSEVADVDADSRGQGYRRSEWGAEVGIEQEIAEAAHIGLAFSMGRASISPSSGARYHEDSQMLDAYYVGAFGRWMNRTSIGVGFHQHDLERRMGNGMAPSADGVSGTSFNFMEEISYYIPVSDTATLRPFFAIESSVNNIDGFAETGASTLSLMGDSQDAWATDITLGLGYEQSFAALSNAPLASFNCHAGVTASVGDTTSDLRLRFSGNPRHAYEQSSADRDRWGLNLGAGVSVPVTRFTTIFATAETILRGDSTSFDAQLGVRWNF